MRASVSLVVSLLSISLLAQPPTHNRRHGTTHATSLTADDCSLQFQGSTSTIHVMETPPKVRITGYVFLDSAHGSTKFCQTSGGRGIHHNGTQQVRGLWEVHPVLEVSSE